MMSTNDNIKKGGLSDKMSSFAPEPPGMVWENISGQISPKKSRKGLIIFLSVAASVALALTLGLSLFFSPVNSEIAESGSVVPAEQELVGEAASLETENSDRMISEDVAEGHKLEKRVQQALEQEYVVNHPNSEDAQFAQQLTNEEANRMQTLVASNDEGSETSKVLEGNDFSVSTTVSAPENQLDGDKQEEHTFNSDHMETVNEESEEQFAFNEDANVEEDLINEDSVWNVLRGGGSDQERVIVANEDDEQKSSWQMGASLTPLYSYRNVAGGDDYYNLSANTSESGKVTYSGGLQISYLPNDRLTIESGIYYSELGLDIENYSSFSRGSANAVYAKSAVVNVSNTIGTIINQEQEGLQINSGNMAEAADYHLMSPEALQYENSNVNGFSQSLSYLEVPFNLKYKVLDKRLDVSVIGGLSTNMLIGTNVTMQTEEGTRSIGDVGDIKTMNYSGNAGLGFSYQLQGNLSLSLEPRFRYFLNSINQAYLPSTRPYTFGVYTGVNYRF